jgi:hypothetical protein
VVAWSTGRAGEPLWGARFDRAAGWPGGWTRGELRPAVAGVHYAPSDLAMTGGGHAIVGWRERGPADRWAAQAMIFAPGHGWSAPHLLTDVAVSTTAPRVAIASLAATVRAVAVWSRYENGTASVEAEVLAYEPASDASAWTGAARVAGGEDLYLSAELGIDRTGRATVMFTRADAELAASEVSVATYDGAWTVPAVISGPGLAHDASLSVDELGGVLVAWRRCLGPCDVAVRRSSAGAWGPIESVAAMNGVPYTAMSGDQGLVLIDQYLEQSLFGRALAAGAWGAQSVLGVGAVPDVRHGWMVDVATRGGQGGLGAWMRIATDGSGEIVDEIMVSRYVAP